MPMRTCYRKLFSGLPFVLSLLSLLFLPMVGAKAQIGYSENFDYAAGPLYGQGGWGKYGSNPNNPITVTDKALTFEGYPGGVPAKSVKMSAPGSSEDLLVRFDPSESGVLSGDIYYSLLIRVNDVPTKSVFPFAFLQRASSYVVQDGKSPAELGKFFIAPADEAGKVKFGIDKSSSKPAYSADTYEVGRTYLIVVKYAINSDEPTNDIVSLYVNPASYETEPATPAATVQPGTGPGVKDPRGIQGFELRQGGTSSAKAPDMNVAALRISDTYAGLFGQVAPPPSDEPEISVLNKTVNWEYNIYEGDKSEQTLTVRGKNLKGDVTVSLAGDDGLTASPLTLPAAEVQSAEGAALTLSLEGKANQKAAKLTLSSEGAEDVVVDVNWAVVPVSKVATLKELAAGDAENQTIYRYTGEAVVTYANMSGSPEQYYLQDASGAILVKDNYDVMPTIYKQGDKLTGFLGLLESSFGMKTFTPLESTLGTKVSEGNDAEAVKATLAEIKANPANYLNRLVKIGNVTITSDAETFAEGMKQPEISDGSGETGKLRLFKGTSLVGKPIPSGTVTLTGLSTSASALIIAPRSIDDIASSQPSGPSLEVTAEQTERVKGFVGEKAEAYVLNVKATDMPAATSIYLSGKGAANFSLSAETIEAGTNELRLVVYYQPTKIGIDEARVNFDCTDAPELYKSFSISGIATDRNNPPVITVAPVTLDAFTAATGTKQEREITVSSKGLPDYVYLKVENIKGEGAFLINTTQVYKNIPAKVKVTFAPKAAGDYESRLVIYSAEAETVTLDLKGTATGAPSEGDVEGDKLPLSTANPLATLNETFDTGIHNKPLKLDGWKNLAVEGKRAWWGYTFNDNDASAGEKAAKVTGFDSQVEIGGETPCQMLLVTPALDFKNSPSKLFTFRVRGDQLRDEQTDKLELCYIDVADGEMYIAPVEGFSMPAAADLNGEWQEFHIDLTGQNLADVFFMGFRFTSQRGRQNSAVYYIDDVTYGRTDVPVIRLSEQSLAFEAELGKDALSPEVEVSTANLENPVTLSLGGPNKSKFKLSTTTLPQVGGKFSVAFNSDEEGVHEAYVKLSSRGAADIYLPLSVNNKTATGIENIGTGVKAEITVIDVAGRVVRKLHNAAAAEATRTLPQGVYVVKADDGGSTTVAKVKVE